MKKLLLGAALLLNFTVNAQNLNGCMGINFGDSKQSVRTTMGTKPGFEFYKENSETNTVSYMNGTFAGHKAIGGVMHFYKDELHTITILLDVDQEPRATELYYEVINELKTKYNVTPEQAHYFKYPYTEGDGHTITALKRGYADMITLFKFDDGNVISVSITSSISIKIAYQNTRIAGLAIDENNQKRSNDY